MTDNSNILTRLRGLIYDHALTVDEVHALLCAGPVAPEVRDYLVVHAPAELAGAVVWYALDWSRTPRAAMALMSDDADHGVSLSQMGLGVIVRDDTDTVTVRGIRADGRHRDVFAWWPPAVEGSGWRGCYQSEIITRYGTARVAEAVVLLVRWMHGDDTHPWPLGG